MGCIDDSIDELPFVTDEVDWRGVVFNEDEDGNEGERPDELVDEVAGEWGWWFFFTSDGCLADVDWVEEGGGYFNGCVDRADEGAEVDWVEEGVGHFDECVDRVGEGGEHSDKGVTRSGGCTAPAFSTSPNFDTARFGFGFLCSIIFLHISGILFP